MGQNSELLPQRENCVDRETKPSNAPRVTGQSALTFNASHGVASPMKFDLASIRMDQDFSEGSEVEKAIVSVPIMKPHRHAWINVSNLDSHRHTVGIIEFGKSKEIYVVHPKMAEMLRGKFVLKELFLYQNTQRDYFWWAIKKPDESGDLDRWNKSAKRIATTLANTWIQVASNKATDQYDIFTPKSKKFEDPDWSKVDGLELIEKAVSDILIDNMEHPVVKNLFGIE